MSGGIRRTGIVEGNLVVGQSGGPTAVINQSLMGVIREARFHKDYIKKIYGMHNGIEGFLKEDMIDLGGKLPRELAEVASSPASGLGSCRKKPTEEDCKKIFEICRKHDVRYFFYIGGNDSALAAGIINRIAAANNYELRVFHVPKTIDNDLLVTDHCPGYGSAAKYVAQCFMGNDLDQRALPGIKIDVCMGRTAGWLTAASALARRHEGDGPHLIYVPERPKTLREIISDISRVYKKYKRCLVAVSEGICDRDGHEFLNSEHIRRELHEMGMQSVIKWMDAFGEMLKDAGRAEKDSFGHVQLSGTGALADMLACVVAAAMKRETGKAPRVRSDTLGYAQRSFAGIVSEVDSREALMVGEAAVKYSILGNIDGSVVIERTGNGEDYHVEPALAPLDDVAGLKLIDAGKPNHKPLPDRFLNAEGNDVTPEFIEYAKPLVGTLPPKGLLRRGETFQK
ncbi:MAG: 6-phosphofructokinase [Planctomycetota bacterium]|nr:6-phosphofructokinase [Planctomycetota bacterium]